jgi:hypothetical protein
MTFGVSPDKQNRRKWGQEAFFFYRRHAYPLLLITSEPIDEYL